MFTGIIEERATVRAVTPNRLEIVAERVVDDLKVDDSLAVNGVCLTVVGMDAGVLSFDVTPETLDRSSLGGLRSGSPVNLERPITLSTRLGGHIVQGHVDGVGEFLRSVANEAGATVEVRIPGELASYVVEKGSIAIDGVSLTVAEISDDVVKVALIPHTLDLTTLGTAAEGDPVNIEVDVIARYVESLMTKEMR